MRRLASANLLFAAAIWINLIACGGGGAGAPGGGLAGGPQALDTPPTSINAASGPGTALDAANVPMPDVYVAPTLDGTEDPNGVHYSFHFRIKGEATVKCLSTEDPFALGPRSKFPSPRRFAWPSIWIGNAYASQQSPNQDSSSTNINNPPPSVTLGFGSSPNYTHFLYLQIQGQVQYNVNGGEFIDWKAENFTGNRYLRLNAATGDYRDVLIAPDGTVSLPFIFRFTAAPTLANFVYQMSHLTIYRGNSIFTPNALTEQKQCDMFCAPIYALVAMDPFASDSPQFGSQPDFAALPACEPNTP